ncbi:MAG: acyltransferase [Nocardioides sp.]
MSASAHVSLEEDTSPADPLRDREAQVAALTGLRGFAALMVVLVHVSVRTDYPWLGLPAYGPVMLFVLSGFLLYRPWARWVLRLGRNPDLPVYSRRRVARIFPAYLVVLFAIAAIYPPARPVGVDGWLYNITLTWIYVPGQFPEVLAQTWSLATELSWYVALPVMAIVSGVIARRWPPAVALRIVAALMWLSLPVTIAWWAWIRANDLSLYFTYSFWLPGYLVCFAGGALIGLYAEAQAAGITDPSRVRRIASDPWALPLFLLAVALLSTSAWGGPDGYVPHSFVQEQVRLAASTLIAIVMLLMVVFGPTTSPLSRLMSTRVLTASGRWSYSIYLWHLPLLVMLEDKVATPEAPLADFLFTLTWALGLSIPLSAATYLWVEKPAIDWSRRPMRLLHYRRRERGRRIAEPAAATPKARTSSSTTDHPSDAVSTTRASSAPDV